MIKSTRPTLSNAEWISPNCDQNLLHTSEPAPIDDLRCRDRRQGHLPLSMPTSGLNAEPFVRDRIFPGDLRWPMGALSILTAFSRRLRSTIGFSECRRLAEGPRGR